MKRIYAQTAELALVTLITIGLIYILDNICFDIRGWLLIPFILVGASVIPCFIRGDGVASLGLNLNRPFYSIRLLVFVSLPAFTLTAAGIWLLKNSQTPLPLLPGIEKGKWLGWILYQFMYVALAEEIFFRGYILGRLLRLEHLIATHRQQTWRIFTVIISAVVFALSHVILLGNAQAALTFFPGLILGWLFLRTRSLLAPVLFHATANIFYALLC